MRIDIVYYSDIDYFRSMSDIARFCRVQLFCSWGRVLHRYHKIQGVYHKENGENIESRVDVLVVVGRRDEGCKALHSSRWIKAVMHSGA